VTTKSDPEQISFYMPTSDPDVTSRKLYMGRRTYVALFGSDGLVYASDINYGFFILQLNEHTVLPPGAAGIELDRAGRLNVRVATSAGSHTFAFSTQRSGRVSLGVFDVAGRRVHSTTRDLAAGDTRSRGRAGWRVASARRAGSTLPNSKPPTDGSNPSWCIWRHDATARLKSGASLAATSPGKPFAGARFASGPSVDVAPGDARMTRCPKPLQLTWLLRDRSFRPSPRDGLGPGFKVAAIQFVKRRTLRGLLELHAT
jgi:hypothetical protein